MFKNKNKLFSVLFGLSIGIGSLPAMELQDQSSSLKREREEFEGEGGDPAAKRPRQDFRKGEVQSHVQEESDDPHLSLVKKAYEGDPESYKELMDKIYNGFSFPFKVNYSTLFKMEKKVKFKDYTPQEILLLSRCNFDLSRLRNFQRMKNIFQGLKTHVDSKTTNSDSDLQYALALCYLKGIPGIIDQNVTEAFALLEELRDREHAWAIYTLASLYSTGEYGREKNSRLSIDLYEKASKLGHILSKIELSMCCIRGVEGIVLNPIIGFEILEDLAGQGHTKLKEELKKIYQDVYDKNQTQSSVLYLRHCLLKEGIGCDKNVNEAIKVCKVLAEKGYVNAQYDLYKYYWEGVVDISGNGKYDFILERNEEEALRYCHLAADKGHPKACYQLYLFYKNGAKGIVERNESMAADMLKKANDLGCSDDQGDRIEAYSDDFDLSESIEQENFEEQYSLAQTELRKGERGDKNEQKAIQLLTTAADNGHVFAQCDLGELYLDREEYELATKYLHMAMKKGNVTAALLLAEYYKLDDPSGILEQDLYKAFQIYNEIDKGLDESEAQFALGEFYMDGIPEFLEQNKKIALFYFKSAADRGNMVAQYRYGKYCDEGVPEIGFSVNFEEALRYMRLSVQQNYLPAIYELGYWYEIGIEDILPIDFGEAVKLYKAVCEQSDEGDLFDDAHEGIGQLLEVDMEEEGQIG